MRLIQADSSKGLLWDGKFGETVKRDLPLLDVSDITDPELQATLLRDYTFLLAGYILEPCDINYRNTQEYGIGRDHVPKNIAVPVT